MEEYATPILFSVGNIVRLQWGGKDIAGVVLEVDHQNAAAGGKMNYKVAMIIDGEVRYKHWYTNDGLTLLDDGTAESK